MRALLRDFRNDTSPLIAPLARQTYLSRTNERRRVIPTKASQRGERHGFSLLEMLIVIAVIGLLLSMILPKTQQIMMASREIAVMRDIETIHTAQTQYYSVYSRYAVSLEALGPAPNGGKETAERAGLLPDNLAAGKKGGYLWSLVGADESYAVWAIPEKWNNTGRRTFYSDQTHVLRNNWSAELAGPASEEVGDGPKGSNQ